MHLGIFVEPFLTYILSGQKTVESRFSARQVPPFGCVCAGDIILLKRSGGSIIGLCQVSNVWMYRLNASTWNGIRSEFAEAMCAQDPEFWQMRSRASYATLMRLADVVPIAPLAYPKRDRRGWVVIRSTIDQLSFSDALSPMDDCGNRQPQVVRTTPGVTVA